MITIAGVINKSSQTVTGSLKGIVSAKIPQDITVTPSNIEQTIKADEGCYLRSVIVKAIENKTEETNNEKSD